MSEGAASASAYRGGEHIGRYRVLGRVGSGGMSVVYKALDLELERTVALKFLHQQVSTQAEKEQLLAEARAASRLDHVNVGVVHGLEQTEEGQWFMVMAYYEGVTLERKIGALLTAQALDISLQTARGLAHAHAHHVLHRDIKPSNVILTPSGTVKIVDFGIARLVPTASETLSAAAKGTAPYMSPEQILGKGADARSDIWALGVVLAQMLSCEYPFRGDNIGAKIYAILNDAPITLDGIPVVIQAIVYRALAKNPNDRYQTCEEIIADLEHAQRVLSPAVETTHDGDAVAQDVAKLRKQAAIPHPGQVRVASPRSWLLRIGIVLVGVLLALLATPAMIEFARNHWFGEKEKHIAVLPFDVIGNDLSLAPLADGLMDSLTSKLSNLDAGQQSFWVVPSSVVRRQKVDDPRTALRDLGATLVVKGSIQRSGSTVRLIVNLISTKPVRQLASADFEDVSGNFSLVQDEAVEKLSRVMNVAGGASIVLAGEKTSVPGVYESYLKALGYMQRYDKPGNLDLAVEELTSATQRDPTFALAFAQLGEAYRQKYTLDKNLDWLDKALAACKQALSLNDHIARAWVTSGRVHTDRGQHDLALKEYERAIELAPRDQDALAGLAHGYESAGQLALAEETYKKAVAIRPDYWNGYNVLALFYKRQHRYSAAIKELKQAIQLTPDNSAAYINLAAVYLDSNDPKYLRDAEAALQRSIKLTPSYGAYTNLGFMYLQQKRFGEAAIMTERAAELNGSDPQVWDNLGLAYEWLGNSPKANAARQKQFELVYRAATAKPQDAQLQSTLGALFARKGQNVAALAHARAALVLAPNDSDVLADVAEIHELLGDHAGAIAYARNSLANGRQMSELERSAVLQRVLSDPKFASKK
jgi:tetratricopeptide (TPR) repeat protein